MLIQTLAQMTPGMVLDLKVQEVLEDGSVTFSDGPVPGLVLRASRYHWTGEHCTPTGSWGPRRPALLPAAGFTEKLLAESVGFEGPLL